MNIWIDDMYTFEYHYERDVSIVLALRKWSD